MGTLLKNFNRLLSLDLMLRHSERSDAVVVIRDDGIGDFLLFCGLLSFYEDFFSKSCLKMYLIVKEELYKLASLYMPEDRILKFSRKLYYADLRYRRSFLRSLLDLSPSLIVSSIHRSSWADDIVRFAGRGVYTIGYEGEIYLKKKGSRIFKSFAPSFDRLYRPRGMYNHVIHHEIFYYGFISGDMLSVNDCRPFIKLRDVRQVDHFTWIVGAGDFKRVYPVEKQARVISMLLADTGYDCVLIGTLRERWVARRLIELIPAPLRGRVRDMTGKVGIVEGFYIIKSGKFTVGAETGMTHASWIMGVPTVVIYGGGHFGRFMPLSDAGNVVYKKLECFCCNWKCRYKDIPFRCISLIDVKDVYSRVMSIL